MSGRGAVWGLVVLGLGPVGCTSGGTAPVSPPPAGLPYLPQELDVSLHAVGDTCDGLGQGLVVARSTGVLTQDDAEVHLTLSLSSDTTVRPLALRGCVLGDEASGFRLRLEGSAHAATTTGASTCTARMALPYDLGVEIDVAAAEAARTGVAASSLGTAEDAWVAAGCPDADAAAGFPFFEVAVCSDGHLEGELDAQVAFSGAICHADAPCRVRLRLAGAVSVPANAPEGALLGGPCGP